MRASSSTDVIILLLNHPRIAAHATDDSAHSCNVVTLEVFLAPF